LEETKIVETLKLKYPIQMANELITELHFKDPTWEEMGMVKADMGKMTLAEWYPITASLTGQTMGLIKKMHKKDLMRSHLKTFVLCLSAD
jgi:hypothetical protein